MIPFNVHDHPWQTIGLWPTPVQPGIYVVGLPGSAKAAEVCPNSRAVLKSVGKEGMVLVALPTGGLDLDTALAFEVLDAANAAQIIREAQTDLRGLSLSIPSQLAGLLPAVSESGGESSSQPNKKQRLGLVNTALTRMRWAIRLGVGQTLLFSVPLLLFGLAVWLAGLAMWWVAVLTLALFWPIVPGPNGLIKGLLAGTVLGALWATWMVLASAAGPWSPALGLWLCAIWAGLVLPGAK